MIRLSGKPLLLFLLFSGKKSTNYLWRCPSLAFSRAQFHGGLLPAINMICPPLLLLSLLLASNHTRLRVPFRSGAFGNEGGRRNWRAADGGGEIRSDLSLADERTIFRPSNFPLPVAAENERFFGQTQV